MNKNDWKISFILCTFNGEKTVQQCLLSIFNQDYPLNKIEVIIGDGGSRDKTLETIDYFKKKYAKNVIFFNNKKQYSEGRGMGKQTGSEMASGDLICFIDQDNILVQKNWINEMIKPFENREVVGAQSRLAIYKQGTIIDKYLSAIGVEDPFAIPYSLNARLTVKGKKEGDYFIHQLDKDNFMYGGNNGFMIRKEKFFENGGYTQDIDNFYRMATKQWKIAIPNNAKLYHKTSVTFRGFLKKRAFYVMHYLIKNYNSRDFFWISAKSNSFKQNAKFIKTVLFNLLFVPGLVQGLFMALRERKAFLLIHPFMLFSITILYILIFLYTKIKN